MFCNRVGGAVLDTDQFSYGMPESLLWTKSVLAVADSALCHIELTLGDRQDQSWNESRERTRRSISRAIRGTAAPSVARRQPVEFCFVMFTHSVVDVLHDSGRALL